MGDTNYLFKRTFSYIKIIQKLNGKKTFKS